MSLNKEALNYFASSMVDLQLDRNPLSQEVILIFNKVQRDHYQDSIVTEEGRVKKRAIVKKDLDMSYVQQLGDVLLEDDDDHIPWIVSMSMTNLIRIPRTDDQILIDGVRYYVSYVKPVNRSIDSIVNISIYPDRNDEDKLAIYSLQKLNDGFVDILYGGNPKQIAFDSRAISDPDVRLEFESIVKFPSEYGRVYIFDDTGQYVSFKYDFR